MGSLITAGAGVAGGVLGNLANSQNTASANEQSAKNQAAANAASLTSSREQMEFQERMSNSAYQRSMQDMQKAGLNPMLAYMKGGASTPSGASYTAGAPDVKAAQYNDPIGPALTSGFDAYSKTKTLAQAAEGLKIQNANSQAEIALKAAQVANTTASAKNASIQAEILAAQAKKSKLDGDFYGSKTGKTLYYLNQINEAAGGSLETLKSAKDLINPLKFLDMTKDKKRGTLKDGTKFNYGTGEIIP